MFSKIKNHLINNRTPYITFLISVIIISIIYYLQEVSPFGENSMLTIDFYHQYGPMLGELYDRIRNGSQMIYSFNMGMGTPFIRNFMNYLSSPFNLIMLLFQRENILTSFSVIIGLKAVAASAMMSFYLSKKFKNNTLYTVPLGILYGFCAYFTAYYWNIMWLDGLVMLPLVVFGVEKLINENRPWLYIISLTIMLFANFFIGYMICLFALIYFVAYLALKTYKINIKVLFKKCLLFGISSLLAGGLVAVFLIPLFLAINSISAGTSAWPDSQYYAFTVWEFLANHFTGVGSTVLASGISNAPNISIGILGVALLFIFIINPAIKLKVKIVYLSLLSILIASFFIVSLDFIWHAFHVPNDLPYRYSFLYSFVLIIIAAYAIINIKKVKFLYVTAIYVLTLGLVSLLHFFGFENIDSSMIFFNMLLLTLYFTLYALYVYYPKIRFAIPYILILGVMLEISVSINNNWNIQHNIPDFYWNYDSTRAALNFVNEHDRSLMFRIEKIHMLSLNDPSWFGYFGQTTFSSMAYENMAILKNYLGLPGNNINSYFFRQTTPVYNLMFNIRYFIGPSVDSTRYSLIYYDEGTTVFQANRNAGLMFSVNESVRDWHYFGTNPLDIQNEFIERATGVQDVFKPLTILNTEIVFDDHQHTIIRYTFINPDDNIYFYTRDFSVDFMIINGNLHFFSQNWHYFNQTEEEIPVYHFIDANEQYVINVQPTEAEVFTMYVGYNFHMGDSFYAYTIDHEAFENAAFQLERNRVILTEFRENFIEGGLFAEDNQIIFTSIPFDKGWQVSVNGERVETFTVGNALLAFEIDAGENHIVMKFSSPGIGIGAIISAISFIILSIGIIFRKKVLKIFD